MITIAVYVGIGLLLVGGGFFLGVAACMFHEDKTAQKVVKLTDADFQNYVEKMRTAAEKQAGTE